MNLNSIITILVVDDEEYVRNYLMEMLSSYGYKVFMASSVTEALSILELIKIDLIISDIIMSPSNGLELIERVKNCGNCSAKIIASSASGDCLDDALKFGANSILEKPFRIEQLLEVMNQVMKKA